MAPLGGVHLKHGVPDLRDTLFRIVYGRDPPTIRSHEPGEARVAAVAKTMAEREEFLQDVWFRLEQAQAVQKPHYDKLHRAVTYAMGDRVLLRLRHRPIASLPDTVIGKLKPRFFEPYQVMEVINAVVVRVALLPRARLHDVFHVRLLKKWEGAPPAAPPPLLILHNGATVPGPDNVVRTRLSRGVCQVLVR